MQPLPPPKPSVLKTIHAGLAGWHWLLVALVAGMMLIASFWGLPNAKRVAIITGGRSLSATEISELNQARQRYLEWAAAHGSEVARRLAAGEQIKEGLPRRRPDAALGPEGSRLALRAYLLGSGAIDERHIYHALSQMKPAQLNFDPHFYVYGGAYVYPVGAAICAGKLLGLINITTDLGYYLQHPEQIARMYLAGRWLSLAGYLAVMVVLGLWAMRLAGPAAAGLAMAAWALSSLPLWMALVTKPHTWAAGWGLAALYLLQLQTEAPRRWRIWASGAALGLAMGSTITSGLLALAFPVLLYERRRPWAWLGQCLAAGLAALAVFILTNPYAVLNFYGYASQWILEAHTEDASRGSLGNTLVFWSRVLIGDFAFPAVLLGPVFLLARSFRGPVGQRRLGLAVLILACTLGGIFGHRRVALVLGALLCLGAGLGLEAWVLRGRWAGRRPRQALLLMIMIPGLCTQGIALSHAIGDDAWYAPTMAWLEQARPHLKEGLGVFGLPDPTNQPPAPWLETGLVNLHRHRAGQILPRCVLLGNYGSDREHWQAHPWRERYRLAAVLGFRPSYDWLRAIRMESDARTAGWVYELTDAAPSVPEPAPVPPAPPPDSCPDRAPMS
ncbi:MAG: hypothetical protein V1797_19200 [Pseudomonadota bacterium]